MRILAYDLVGESAYVNAVDIIRKDLECLHDDDYAFDMAVNEAVLNAAQYSVDGAEKAKIHIEFHVTDYDVVTKVSSKTKHFDMFAHRNQLLAMVLRPDFKSVDWTDYVADSDRLGRGSWYMLSGSDYIYMDRYAQYVCLCASNPCNKDAKTSNMRDLLMRFFVVKDGVLL